jgi:hypothetical protein
MRIGGTPADALVDGWVNEVLRIESEAREPLAIRRRALRKVQQRPGTARVVNFDALIETQMSLLAMVEFKTYPLDAPRVAFPFAFEYQDFACDSLFTTFDQGLAYLNAIVVVRERDAELFALVDSIRTDDEIVVAPWLLWPVVTREAEPSASAGVEHAQPRETRAGPSGSNDLDSGEASSSPEPEEAAIGERA